MRHSEKYKDHSFFSTSQERDEMRYNDEIYYLRTQNQKYEHINNELLMERNLYVEKYKNAEKAIQDLERKLEKEKAKNSDLKKLIKSSRQDLKSLQEISENLKKQLNLICERPNSRRQPLQPVPKSSKKLHRENEMLNKENLHYQSKLHAAAQEMEKYREEINKSMFEVDLYKNQVERLTNLTQSQEKVLSFVNPPGSNLDYSMRNMSPHSLVQDPRDYVPETEEEEDEEEDHPYGRQETISEEEYHNYEGYKNQFSQQAYE
ncbi:unnamed protein product [Moneuplotes crassus]|uniref:Uncharacterized protein n=1 Tax=Euplotes crassus TaxID=5936 RepID=A0AAD2D1V2_EUPCR|nr:unnamed protein product [Moneuplotes crassus]